VGARGLGPRRRVACGREWEATSLGDDGTWQVRLGPHELGSGEHAFEARAVGDDGSVSVWRPVGLNVSLEAVEPAAGGGGGWGWWAAGAAVVAVAAVYVWKGRPDLLDRALRMMHIRHAPAAAAA
jgi:hypothetical protein